MQLEKMNKVAQLSALKSSFDQATYQNISWKFTALFRIQSGLNYHVDEIVT